MLQRNGLQRSNLAAVAAVGGGAGIPLIGARLSDHLQVPIHTAPQPAFSAAIGAAVLGQEQAAAGVATAAGPVVENPTELVETARVAGGERPVAWSDDADDAAEPVPYTGPDMTGEYGREATRLGDAERDRYAAATASLPWYKRTALVLSVVGAGAAVLVAVLLALTLGPSKSNPVNTPNEPAPQTSQTVTITGPNDSTTVTVIPPPPASSTKPPATTTTSQPTTTTTQAPTTTSAQPTTTSQATTTAAPTTTRERPSRPGLPFPR